MLARQPQPAADASFDGTLVLTNHGLNIVSIRHDEPLHAVVARPGTHDVVAPWFGGDDLAGHVTKVPSGESVELPIQGMTEDCDAMTADPAIAAGKYFAVAVIPHDETGADSRPIPAVVLSNEAAIEVVGH